MPNRRISWCAQKGAHEGDGFVRDSGGRCGAVVAKAAIVLSVVVALLAAGAVPAMAHHNPGHVKNNRGFSITGASVTEGDAGTALIVFTVTLSGSTAKTATVRYSTGGGTASPPSDYSPANGMLSFPKGVTQRQVAVTVFGDTMDEADEFFVMSLSQATRTKIIVAQANGVITDDDAPSVVSAGAASAPEGDTGANTTLAFPVRLDRPSGLQVTVAFSTTAGTATPGADYTSVSGSTLTFAPGQTFLTAQVTVVGDDEDEGNETLHVTLTSPTNALLGTASAEGTIVDNDPLITPNITIADVTDAEGGSFTFEIVLSQPAPSNFNLVYDVVAGTAQTPADLSAVVNGSLAIRAGDVDVNLLVFTAEDHLDELDETFFVNLRLEDPGFAASIVDGQAVGTITDDDLPPVVTISDTKVSEGDSTDSPNFAFVPVHLSVPSGLVVTVTYQTVDGSAVDGTDYTGGTDVVTFPAGSTGDQFIAVPILGNLDDQPDKTFTLELSAPDFATLGDSTATVTILDDEAAPLPVISVDDPTVTEGDTGDFVLPFTVSLSDFADATVTVDYTVTLAATTVVAGVLVFEPGDTQQVVGVTLPGNTTPGDDVVYTLTLSGAFNGVVSATDGTGTGTVVDNDGAAASNSVSVADATAIEGDLSPTVLEFVVSLAQPASGPLTVNYATSGLTALADEDFQAVADTLHFAAGQQAKVVFVVVEPDVDDEGDERMLLNLTNPSAGLDIADGQAVGTILDDDATIPEGALEVSIGDDTVQEAATTTWASFEVSLTEPATSTVTIDWATATGTAGAADFREVSDGSVQILAGNQRATISVDVLADELDDEGTEQFFVNISTTTPGVTVARAQGIGTILDVQGVLPVVSIGDVFVTEGPTPGTSIVEVTVELDQPSEEDVTVLVTVPSAIEGGEDTTLTIVIPAGSTSATGQVTVEGESVAVALQEVVITDAAGATIAPDSDGAFPVYTDLPIVSIDEVIVTEGPEPGTSIVEVTASLDAPSTEDVTVVVTVPSMTEGGEDTTVTIVIPAGQTSGTGTVVVEGDPWQVDDRAVVITDADGAIIDPDDSSALPVYTDPPIVSIGDVTVDDGATEGTVVVTIPVSLDQPTDVPVVVEYTIVTGTGELVTGTVTIPAGETTAVAVVTIRGTTSNPPTAVSLTGATGGTVDASDSTDTPAVVGGGTDTGDTGDTGGSTTPGGSTTNGGVIDGTGDGAVAGSSLDRFKKVATGYRMVASDGGIFTFGDAPFFGSTGDIRLNQPIVGMATTPSGNGYWLVATDGGIFTFGDAGFHGSTGDLRLNRPIVGMETTPSGQGYWLVADDGGIFAFGDAEFQGSTGDIRLNQPIVGMETTPSGKGYWLVATDGGIFAFGDAAFLGSTGDIRLNQPIVGMAASPSGDGYRLVATDGGIFTFGDAEFLGSTGDIRLNQPIVGMAASPTGAGYWLVATDGGIFTFGDAQFLGSTGDIRLNQPINGMAPVVRTVKAD